MCFLFFIIVSRFDFHLVGGLSNARRRVSHAVVSVRVKLYSFLFGARALPRNILKMTINSKKSQRFNSYEVYLHSLVSECKLVTKKLIV